MNHSEKFDWIWKTEFAMYLCILNSNIHFRLSGGKLKEHLFFER